MFVLISAMYLDLVVDVTAVASFEKQGAYSVRSEYVCTSRLHTIFRRPGTGERVQILLCCLFGFWSFSFSGIMIRYLPTDNFLKFAFFRHIIVQTQCLRSRHSYHKPLRFWVLTVISLTVLSMVAGGMVGIWYDEVIDSSHLAFDDSLLNPQHCHWAVLSSVSVK